MEVPKDCKGCGKCCMIKFLINNPSIIVYKNFKPSVTFHYGRCMYLNGKNECDIYEQERPKPCIDVKRGDNICLYSLLKN